MSLSSILSMDENGQLHYGKDNEVADAILASTPMVKFYDAGVPLNGVAKTGDVVVWTDTTTTTSGNAVFNLLNASSNAMFSSIKSNSVDTSYVDSANMYSKSSPVISSDLKTITIPITKMSTNAVTVAGINVIGSVTMPSAGNGVTVKLFVFGIAA